MSERLWGILVDSFGKILLPGLTVTIPLTAISFTLALIIAVAVALVQFAHVPVLQRLARFYICHPRHARAGAAVRRVLRPARRWHPYRAVPAAVLVFPSMRARTAPRPCVPRWKPCPRGRWRASASA